MTKPTAAVRIAVRTRAGFQCEYCHLPLDSFIDPFHIDHVTARQHGGLTDYRNLALSCSRCNHRKGTNLSAIDPRTKTVVRLFNPRQNIWVEHFQRRRTLIRGITDVGRATVALLDLNNPDRRELRASLINEGSIPANEVS